MIGDFNTTRFVNEKIGGNMMYGNAMTDFHECMFKLELVDIPFLGPIFTWMNRREGVNFIARKLDRCLQNECCLDVFPNVMTEVLQPGLSDHCPLVTRLNIRKDYRGGAVRLSLSLGALASCILGCLWGIALLVINS